MFLERDWKHAHTIWLNSWLNSSIYGRICNLRQSITLLTNLEDKMLRFGCEKEKYKICPKLRCKISSSFFIIYYIDYGDNNWWRWLVMRIRKLIELMFYLLVNVIISFKQGKYTSCYYCFFLFVYINFIWFYERANS